jgi:hypothetical protein
MRFVQLKAPWRGATWFVDKTASGSGTGTSWTNAVTALSSIPWGSVVAGDRVLVSGGSQFAGGKVYGQLSLTKSGTATAPILISGATEAGHNGPAIIDGLITVPSILSNGFGDTIIRNFWVRNGSDDNVYINGSTRLVFEDNIIHCGNGAGSYARGVEIKGSTGCFVRGNYIQIPWNTVSQADAIYSGTNTNCIFEFNWIDNRQVDQTGHSDGIQSYQDHGGNEIRYNTFVNYNNADDNNHMIWLQDNDDGTFILVHSNVVKCMGPDAGTRGLSHYQSGAGTGFVKFYNNSVYGCSRCVSLEPSPNTEIKGNILVPMAGGYGIYASGTAPSTGNVDYNLIFGSGIIPGGLTSGNKTWAQWQALGYDTHGLNVDPLYVRPPIDLHRQAGSPAIGAGVALTGVTFDRNGSPRASPPDIGAYQSVSGPDVFMSLEDDSGLILDESGNLILQETG